MFRENLSALRTDMERLKKGQVPKKKGQKHLSIAQGGLFTTFDNVMAVTDSDDSSLNSADLQ